MVGAYLSRTTTHWESRVPRSKMCRRRRRPVSSARSTATVSLNIVRRGGVTTARGGRGRAARQAEQAEVTCRTGDVMAVSPHPASFTKIMRRSAPG